MNHPFLLENHRLVSLNHSEPLSAIEPMTEAEENALLQTYRQRVIGWDAVIHTPFGEKPLIYADFTASGRFFRDIEDELNERILPFIANTHSETTTLARYITHHYHLAFQKIAHYVHADDEYVLIPVGAGSTGAINRLILAMGLRIPAWCQGKVQRDALPPLVIRSLMEHHSNDIAWRETIAETQYVGFSRQGTIDLNQLEDLVKNHCGKRMIIGTFSAASNVTGIQNDVYQIARILHRYGGVAFFDFAAAAPHVRLDVKPQDQPLDYADALFLSTHKFIGGPRTPGLLIARKSLFSSSVPVEPGGGTVLYTSPWDHRYLPDLTARETGGTPPITQSIQAGLVFDLKERMGIERMEAVEQDYIQRAYQRWSQHPNIRLLGNFSVPRVGIISLIIHEMHHELVVALLNDYYGIQVRGGCMCAGPYGHELLNIDEVHSKFIRNLLDAGHIASKPGWVRVSLSPALSEDNFETLLHAVEEIATHGKQMAKRYEYHEPTNAWVYHKT
ncbi:MAG: aminotransferase class V-fold PLP-dependent enzyme [bacterium]|nr:aminotransferase class V-fold PLP-dependent enzyme [bacterium]